MGPKGYGGFPGGSAVKPLPVMQEALVRSLGREDPLEDSMVIQSCLEPPWTEERGRLQSTGSQEADTTEGPEHVHRQGIQAPGSLKVPLYPPTPCSTSPPSCPMAE